MNYSEVQSQNRYGKLSDELARHLGIAETILRARQEFFAEIRDNIGLQEKIRAMLVSSIVFMALYGAVIGSSHVTVHPYPPQCPIKRGRLSPR